MIARKFAFIALVGMTAAMVSAPAQARDRIRIVGSSTVFPFATTVAEEFGKTTPFKTPVIESTGTGGGFKLFCAGVGVQYPDISDASRAIKKSEKEKCVKNGVGAITQIKIGFDGIVIANSKAAPRLDLTLRQIYLALAKTVPANADGTKLIANPNKTWHDVDPSLPANKILVLGPPPTSGTRDAFVELAMEGGCKTFSGIEALKKTDKNKYKAVCHGIREDGAYVEAGENDNLIVQKLEANRVALGIFGFSYLDQNQDKLQGSLVGGIAPTFETISDSSYPVSRPLFFYVKNAHVGVIPGIKEYVAEFTSDKANGEFGYLIDRGLIPLPAAEHKKVRAAALNFTPLGM